MKIFLALFIMASLSFKLNAFDVTNLPKTSLGVNSLNSPEGKKIQEFIKQAKEAQKAGRNDGKYILEQEAMINDEGPCKHCPRYMALTSEVNKIIGKMAKDPARNPEIANSDLPVRLNRLKFLYFTQKKNEEDGSVSCKRFLDLTPDLRPTKFDGQFKLIAEEVLKFSAVSDVQYFNPDVEETVYYYRGEGADSNVVVQAILTKEGGRLRTFRYYPTEQELNPYNLPDMNKVYPSADEKKIIPIVISESNSTTNPRGISFLEHTSAEEKKKIEAAVEENKLAMEQMGEEETPLLGQGKYDMKFKAEVEKRNKYIPKNIHFVEASADQELLGDLTMKATSDLSLKGNEAKLALKKGGDDLMLVEVKTKLNGKTDHKIVVPFSVRMSEELPQVKGRAETNSQGQVLNLSLTDAGVDIVRSEVRRNGSTGMTSYVLARDIAIAKNEVMSMQYGAGEDKKQFIAMRHAKSIKDNVTLVLDVRVTEDRKATLMYQVNARW